MTAIDDINNSLGITIGGQEVLSSLRPLAGHINYLVSNIPAVNLDNDLRSASVLRDSAVASIGNLPILSPPFNVLTDLSASNLNDLFEALAILNEDLFLAAVDERGGLETFDAGFIIRLIGRGLATLNSPTQAISGAILTWISESLTVPNSPEFLEVTQVLMADSSNSASWPTSISDRFRVAGLNLLNTEFLLADSESLVFFIFSRGNGPLSLPLIINSLDYNVEADRNLLTTFINDNGLTIDLNEFFPPVPTVPMLP